MNRPNILYINPDQIQADLEKRLLDWYIHTSDVRPFERQKRNYPEGVLVP